MSNPKGAHWFQRDSQGVCLQDSRECVMTQGVWLDPGSGHVRGLQGGVMARTMVCRLQWYYFITAMLVALLPTGCGAITGGRCRGRCRHTNAQIPIGGERRRDEALHEHLSRRLGTRVASATRARPCTASPAVGGGVFAGARIKHVTEPSMFGSLSYAHCTVVPSAVRIYPARCPTR
jgi:hypothetical protein